MANFNDLYEENLIELPLFSGDGLERPVMAKREDLKKKLALYQKSQNENLKNLNSLFEAKGGNLRRIASYVGFSSDIEDDEEFRREFEFYLYAKNSNGSLNFIQTALSKLRVDINLVDTWQRFEFDNLLLDGSWVLDGEIPLDPEAGSSIKFYEAYVDFLCLDYHFEKKLEDFVSSIRYIGRRVLPREVLECYRNSPNSLVYNTNLLVLDGSWLLDGNFNLDPEIAIEGNINEIQIGNGAGGNPPLPSDTGLNNPIYTNTFLEKRLREENLIFSECDISNFTMEYDEIGFFSSGILQYKITFPTLRRFNFEIKILRLNLDEVTNG